MSLYAELKRRNVFRVAIAYIVFSWLMLQIVDVLVELLALQSWVGKLVFVLLFVGFPMALIFAWAFELTPEGLKRDHEVDPTASITHVTGRKLDFVIIGVLSIALAWFAWDKFLRAPAPPPEVAFTTGVTSVAVLPFIAMSSGPDDVYFADGLTEEILNALAQLPELRVTARTSAFSFKGQDLPVQQIAEVLGVGHIVEGSVRRSGERLRVTAQLIRTDDGFHLWSDNFDSTTLDTITVQETIAEQIASSLDVVLDEEKREAMRRAGIRDVEAFIAYQQGVESYYKAHGDVETIEGLRRANHFFDRVIERTPEFAPVYTMHSDLYTHMLQDHANRAFLTEVSDEEIQGAYAAALADYQAANRYARNDHERAVSDFDLAFFSGNWNGIRSRAERVLSGPPCTGSGNWIGAYPFLGLAEVTHRFYLERIECDPRLSILWFQAARAALWMGDTDEALRLAREGLETAPGSWLNVTLVRTLIARGEYDEAARVIDNRVTDSALALVFRIMSAASAGDRERAQELADLRSQSGDADGFWNLHVAAWSGNREAANAEAATIDAHPFGAVTLALHVVWCACGAPWDLEATPNFAAKVRAADTPWPPRQALPLPLKDW